jgi:hypothetical protein
MLVYILLFTLFDSRRGFNFINIGKNIYSSKHINGFAFCLPLVPKFFYWFKMLSSTYYMQPNFITKLFNGCNYAFVLYPSWSRTDYVCNGICSGWRAERGEKQLCGGGYISQSPDNLLCTKPNSRLNRFTYLRIARLNGLVHVANSAPKQGIFVLGKYHYSLRQLLYPHCILAESIRLWGAR